MKSNLIYKVLTRPEWTQAEAAGEFAGAAIDLTDGYIHFSTADQLAETVQKHFAGQDNLLIVAVDANALKEVCGDRLKWEPSRGGALFPHLYTALPASSAVQVLDLPMHEDGSHRIPETL